MGSFGLIWNASRHRMPNPDPDRLESQADPCGTRRDEAIGIGLDWRTPCWQPFFVLGWDENQSLAKRP